MKPKKKIQPKQYRKNKGLAILTQKMNMVGIKLGYVSLEKESIFKTVMMYLKGECGAALDLFKVRMLSTAFRAEVDRYFDFSTFRSTHYKNQFLHGM